MTPGSHDNRLAGIAMMLIGIFFFALNDALGKWLIATYSVGQLLLVRSVAGLVFLAPFVKREGWSAFADAPQAMGAILASAVFDL